jgi:hypothetical protein
LAIRLFEVEALAKAEKIGLLKVWDVLATSRQVVETLVNLATTTAEVG